MKGSFKTMEARIRKINRNFIGVLEKDTRREKAIFKKTKAENFQELIYRHEVPVQEIQHFRSKIN